MRPTIIINTSLITKIIWVTQMPGGAMSIRGNESYGHITVYDEVAPFYIFCCGRITQKRVRPRYLCGM